MIENNLSPWGIVTADQLSNALADIYFKEHRSYNYKLKLTGESLWIVAGKRDKEELVFRTAFSPGNDLQVKSVDEVAIQIRPHLQLI